MLRHLRLLAVCACIVASVGCDGGRVTAPAPPPPPSSDPNTTVTVEFGGRMVNADAGDPVASVQVSLHVLSSPSPAPGRSGPDGWVFPKNTATSGGDGAFTLPLTLPSSWRFISLRLIAPPGYDDTQQRFEPNTAAERPAIRMYPTLVIRPGESIEVRVDSEISWCGWDGYACRRVLVAAATVDSVELEVVSLDSSKSMALGLANPEYPYILEPDMSVGRLMVPAGGVPYVVSGSTGGTARLTARR
jgi:hypothetical protein